jgi:hypothetical protein
MIELRDVIDIDAPRRARNLGVRDREDVIWPRSVVSVFSQAQNKRSAT